MHTKIVYGLLTYDQIKCADYCVDKLKKEWICSSLCLSPLPLMYISWEHVPSVIRNPEVKNYGN